VILHGDCLEVLRTLPAASVHACITSPPYWGLRNYKTAPVLWGGDPACVHDFPVDVDTCDACGAWLGHLGLEPTPELFIAHMVDIFREVRRVLRDDGTLWLNIGDCYAGVAAAAAAGVKTTLEGSVEGQDQSRLARGSQKRAGLHESARQAGAVGRAWTPAGIKEKDLVVIPWMLAFALRADGWYLRAENIWAKGISFCDTYAGSVMPESVTDRPTRGHEQVFLLAKSPRYFYDQFAVKERGVYPAGTLAAKGSGQREGNRRGSRKKDLREAEGERRQTGRFQDRWDKSHHKMAAREDGNHPWDGYAMYDGTRNLRTVWAIGVQPFAEAHFATFPPDLVHPCIAAGTSAHGVCAACGAPYARVVEQEDVPDDVKQQFEAARSQTAEDHGRGDGFTTRRPNYQRKTRGERWQRTCACETTDVVPATVLDPFSGAGTTGVECARMQRTYLGIELNADYIALAERRIAAVAPLFGETA